jgi:hypothetical protein
MTIVAKPDVVTGPTTPLAMGVIGVNVSWTRTDTISPI